MKLSPAETCRKVADIIDFESKKFDIGLWGGHPIDDECGTTACIAGHVAILHDDWIEQNEDLSYRKGLFVMFEPDLKWQEAQAKRLGLTFAASELIFFSCSSLWSMYNEDEQGYRYSMLLQQLEKELENRDEDDLIDEEELERIAEEAFL